MSAEQGGASGPHAASGPEAPAPDELARVFDEALRGAATASSGAASRPGQLRHQVVRQLGPDAARSLHVRVHRAVAAAEERIPATLVSMAPISEVALGRIARELATRRGWTTEAADETVRDWCRALGVAPGPASEPSVPLDLSWPDDDAPGTRDGAGTDPVGPDGPAGRTGPVSDPWPIGPAATPVGWTPAPPPTVRPRTARLAQVAGWPGHPAAHAYGGMPLRLFWVLVSALVVVAMAAALVLPQSVPGRANYLVSGASALAAIGLSTRLRRGLLVLTGDGLAFVPFDRTMTTPKGDPLVVPWGSCQVTDPGTGGWWSVGEVSLGGRRVQVGPEGSSLLRHLVGCRP